MAGLVINAIARLLQPILGLTRLPLALNAILLVGWVIATDRVARGKDARVALWILGIGHAIAMLAAIGRLGAAIALMLAAVGLFLAAGAWGSAGSSTCADR